MYKVKYTYNSVTKESELYAKFRFRKDVAPKDVAELKKRIQPSPYSFIANYLRKRLNFYDGTSTRFDCSFETNNGTVTIDNWWATRLGFNLLFKTHGNIAELEQKLDLDELNSAVIKGEMHDILSTLKCGVSMMRFLV